MPKITITRKLSTARRIGEISNGKLRRDRKSNGYNIMLVTSHYLVRNALHEAPFHQEYFGGHIFVRAAATPVALGAPAHYVRIPVSRDGKGVANHIYLQKSTCSPEHRYLRTESVKETIIAGGWGRRRTP